LPERSFNNNPSIDLMWLPEALKLAGLTREAALKADLLPSHARLPGLATVLDKTADPTPFNTLARLFLMGRPVPAEEIERALGHPLSPLVESGILRIEGDLATANAAMMIHEGLLVLRDFELNLDGKPLSPDHVLGVGFVTRMLANLTVRRSVARALDVGTGQGYQAMLASRHAGTVIGTDVNERALDFAAMNARLNGITNIVLRKGSFYEPVAGEAPFDLIVSNPPFVISPPHGMAFAGGALEGDGLVQTIVEGAPAHLAEGGYAIVLLNWHHTSDHDWAARPKGWVEGKGCDAWLVRCRTDTPQSYAGSWLKEIGSHSGRAQDDSLHEWLAYYERLGAGAISMGAILLRKRRGSNFWRAETIPLERFKGAAAAQVERIFDNEVLLQTTPDRARLLDLPLVLTPDHELEQRMKLGVSPDSSFIRAMIRQTQGFEMPLGLDAVSCHFLGACSGKVPVRTIISELARRLGTPEAQFAAQSVGLVELLLKHGYLSMPQTQTR
jgi:methylase of polypeptide subunit release factors